MQTFVLVGTAVFGYSGIVPLFGAYGFKLINCTVDISTQLPLKYDVPYHDQCRQMLQKMRYDANETLKNQHSEYRHVASMVDIISHNFVTVEVNSDEV